jgi:hypothetical protein
MIRVWHNVNSFRRHLEEMHHFRQSHAALPTESLKTLRDLPVLSGVQAPQETGLIRSLADCHGKTVIVPIWDVTLTRGTQN